MASIVLGLLTTVGVAWTGAIAFRFSAFPLHRCGLHSGGDALWLWISEDHWSGSRLSADSTGLSHESTSPTEREQARAEREFRRDLLLGESSPLEVAVSAETAPWWSALRSAESFDDYSAGWGFDSVFEDVRGWPLPALRCRLGFKRSGPASDRLAASRRCIAINVGNVPGLRDSEEGRYLPLEPVWTGLGANTLVYAGAWWMALSLIGKRESRRRKRGLCPRCGYDLKHASVLGCPECGWNRTT